MINVIKDKAQTIQNLSQGQCLGGDFTVLSWLASFSKNIVELGTSRGLGALILASGGGKVTTIDNFQVIPYFSGDKVLSEREKIQWISSISFFLSHYYPENRITVVHSDSAEAAVNYKDSSLDLLYIDAGHSYECVSRDYNAWINKVQVGGIIAFHDYSELHHEVKRFCDEIASNSAVVVSIDAVTEGQTVIKLFQKVAQ